jgi:hypothetical protein
MTGEETGSVVMVLPWASIARALASFPSGREPPVCSLPCGSGEGPPARDLTLYHASGGVPAPHGMPPEVCAQRRRP